MKGKDLKPHIGIFGRRNAGKSSFINTLVNQEVAIVSDQPGTTTDPVRKSIEIFGIGPCIIIDTAGIDDTGQLGEKRIKKSIQTLDQIDLAVLMLTHNNFNGYETALIEKFHKKDLPYLIVHNKSDIEELSEETFEAIRTVSHAPIVDFSTLLKRDTDILIHRMSETIPQSAYVNTSLFGDLILKDDIVLLITPIDSEAPEGRMILPQVMAIRDVLDNDSISIVLKETEIKSFLKNTGIKPKLVVTDSQAFHLVKEIIPEDMLLTSFSIIFARYRGEFEHYLEGTPKIEDLHDGDKVLILESCTHRVSCDDIGRYKLPRWINEYTGKNLDYNIIGGFDEIGGSIGDYSMVIHCGGCVATRRQISERLRPAISKGIPVSNYGMMIAYLNGIFNRAVLPFTQLIYEREIRQNTLEEAFE